MQVATDAPWETFEHSKMSIRQYRDDELLNLYVFFRREQPWHMVHTRIRFVGIQGHRTLHPSESSTSISKRVHRFLRLSSFLSHMPLACWFARVSRCSFHRGCTSPSTDPSASRLRLVRTIKAAGLRLVGRWPCGSRGGPRGVRTKVRDEKTSSTVVGASAANRLARTPRASATSASKEASRERKGKPWICACGKSGGKELREARGAFGT